MQELLLEESHPLAVKLSFSISLGLLPVTLFMNTVSCGIRNSGLPEEEAGDLESSSKNSNPLPVGQFLRFFFVMILSLAYMFSRVMTFISLLYGQHSNMHAKVSRKSFCRS